jgi:hypothetical protein
MLLAGDTTVLPGAARHSQRVEALIRIGQLVVLDDNVTAPEPRVAPLEAPEDAPNPQDDALAAPDPAEEEPTMPVPGPPAPAHAANGSDVPRSLKVARRPKAKRKRRLSGGARRALAKRAALTQTTEAAQAWAGAGNGHDAGRDTEAAEIAPEPVTAPPEPGIDTLEAARLALASRALGLAERAMELLRPA